VHVKSMACPGPPLEVFMAGGAAVHGGLQGAVAKTPCCGCWGPGRRRGDACTTAFERKKQDRPGRDRARRSHDRHLLFGNAAHTRLGSSESRPAEVRFLAGRSEVTARRPRGEAAVRAGDGLPQPAQPERLRAACSCPTNTARITPRPISHDVQAAPITSLAGPPDRRPAAKILDVLASGQFDARWRLSQKRHLIPRRGSRPRRLSRPRTSQ